MFTREDLKKLPKRDNPHNFPDIDLLLTKQEFCYLAGINNNELRAAIKSGYVQESKGKIPARYLRQFGKRVFDLPNLRKVLPQLLRPVRKA